MFKFRPLEIGVVLSALLSATGVAIPVVTRARDNADRLNCLENLRIIGEGIRKWSELHDFALPPGRGMSGFCNSGDGLPLPGNLYAVEPGLNALWDKGRGVITDPLVFVCPADPDILPPPAVGEDFTSPRQLSYSMTGHLYPTDAPNKVIVADKSDKCGSNPGEYGCANHGGRIVNVLFMNGKTRSCYGPRLPPGVGSELGSIYAREIGDRNDTYLE